VRCVEAGSIACLVAATGSPTPISALIHAATMVTAGILLVAHVAALFELSTTAPSFVMIIMQSLLLFMGFRH
jgi:NADH-quinone oxidoreductase subunit L